MSILRDRHAKILATIGPSSNSLEVLRDLVAAGADAFRLNFSHGSHEDHAKVVKLIREIENEIGHPIAILQDLQGPKIRIGEMVEAVMLHRDALFTLDSDTAPGDTNRVCLPHPEILSVLKAGDKVFINDGIVRLEVEERHDDKAVCRVISGGTVSSRKGVNLPGVELPISSITDKDWKDLEFGLEAGVDWVAVSFVQRAEDMHSVRKRVGNKIALLAKIEMPQAVERIDDIVEASDAIMVARGDLGVEVPLEEVPVIQKKIIRKCRERGMPVVVATQMLESMIHNPMPTRAEVSDVANATFEGADVMMLSAESAAGKHPVAAVETMDKVIRRAERSTAWQPLMEARQPDPLTTIGDAITTAAFYTANVIGASAIVTFTESGNTAWRMSRQRPLQPILALTPHESVARRMVLGWGLHSRLCSIEPTDQDEVVKESVAAVKNDGIAGEGKHIVITAGVPYGRAGTTNFLRVVAL